MSPPRCNTLINEALYYDPMIERQAAIQYHNNRMIFCVLMVVSASLILGTIIIFSRFTVFNIIASVIYVILLLVLIYFFLTSYQIKNANKNLPTMEPTRPCMDSQGIIRENETISSFSPTSSSI